MTVEQLAVELERTKRLSRLVTIKNNDSSLDYGCEYEHTLRKINKSSMLSEEGCRRAVRGVKTAQTRAGATHGTRSNLSVYRAGN